MKIKKVKAILSIFLAFLTFVLFIPYTGMEVSASDTVDPMVIVSLGDSYSSGEGVEPFYGQDKDRLEKMVDLDWAAHRSMNSWPAQLVVPGISGTAKDYRITGTSDGNKACEWYFVAASGGVTKNIYDSPQHKTTRTYAGWACWDVEYPELPIQIDVFNNIDSTVDYVTLSIGGNDVDFGGVVSECVTKSTYLGSKSLEKKLDALWDNIGSTKEKIKKAYTEIQEAAGCQAAIVIAGYPKLLDKKGKGAAISKKEATLVNESVTKFNGTIEALVNECAESGMNIYFVNIEGEFDGHEAYSDNPWINKVILGAQSQDIDCLNIVSQYSMHPNELGTQAYARCVNAKIAEIEATKKSGTLSGKVCNASDRISPVADATITIYKNGIEYSNVETNSTGNYSMTLPVGDYRIEIAAPGYINFSAYATVTENNNYYMETLLLVAGEEGETGTANGTITSALTGTGVEGVSLTVREGWNNTSFGDVVTTTTTDGNGCYSLSLPLGNYTLLAEKEGYITTSINVVVQKEDSLPQNGSITPILSGDNYRIVLTWGVDPIDLDSHVEGILADGSSFHVAYWNRYQMDGEVEVCNLDVDDVTSYGPETITLQTTNDNPYYYYIYHYAGAGSLATSAAQVKLYQGENLVAVFNVPTDLGTGLNWNVFAISNGEITVKNTISNSADVSYVGNVNTISDSF